MRARRSWVVFVDHDEHIWCPEDIPGRYVANKHLDPKILSITFSLEDANHIATQLAEQFPGKDVHVYKQLHGFSSQPKPAESKIWTDRGEYIPAPK